MKKREIPLSGKLVTSDDGITIGENFSTLTNLRYGNSYPKGILGHTKINTSALDYPQIRSIHHLRKEQPAESHVLVQAITTGGYNKTYVNRTAIPSAGNFVGGATETALYTHSAGAVAVRFADAPDGAVICCDGQETLVYGGTEFRVASFIRFDPDDDTKKWDYTEQVSNTLTTDYATLVKSGGTLDTDTVLLLHLDNNVTDSSTSAHTVTNNNVTFSTLYKILGTHCAVFNGSNAYLTIPDSDDFDFGAGVFTIDFWFTNLGAADGTIYYQELDDNNYIRIHYDYINDRVEFNIVSGGTARVTLASGTATYGDHYAIVENGDDYYLWHNGNFADSTSSTWRAGAEIDLTSATYKWTASGGGTNEYYLELAGGGNPSIADPSGTTGWVTLAGTQLTEGTAGSLADHTWDYGDNDTLGYSTIYFRDESGDPDATEVDLKVGYQYTGTVYIGYDNNAALVDYLYGYLDEFNILKGDAKWVVPFIPPSIAYPVNGCQLYVGSILPIESMSFDVGTANTSVTTAPIIFYWDGSNWISVGTVTDGTGPGGRCLTENGIMTFTSTASTAKPKMIDSMYLYWYWLSIPDIPDTVTVTNVRVGIPFQPFKDLWDGELRTIVSCLQWDNDRQSFLDHTLSVFQDNYDSADEGTYADIIKHSDSDDLDWDTGDDYLLIGSSDRLTGLSINLVSGKENDTAATMSISYWDGDSWVSVGSLDDGTLESDTTLSKSGFVTWQPPDYGTEFKRQDLSRNRVKFTREDVRRETGGNFAVLSPLWIKANETTKKSPTANAQHEYPSYWYKIELSADITLAASDTSIFYIGGIPAPAEIDGYKFPVLHNNSVWLLNEPSQHKNQAMKLAPGTVNVANGNGSALFKIGTEEELTGGGSLKTTTNESVFQTLVLFKKNQTWAIYGDAGAPVLVDPNIGCVAPGTIKNVRIKGADRWEDVIMFQSNSGIHGTDGRTVFDLSGDIADVFDQNKTTKILTTRVSNSEAVYDSLRHEYHWIWTSTGTTHNKEYVFDCERLKWFHLERGTGALIQCAAEVRSTDGDAYVYGGTEDGYMMRLENGTTFATASSTNNITYTMELGDLALGGIGGETLFKNVTLHSVGKTSTSNTVAITHYGDTSTTGSSISAIDPGDTGERCQIISRSENLGPHVYHRLKFALTNSTDTVGFEPIYLCIFYEDVRPRTRGS